MVPAGLTFAISPQERMCYCMNVHMLGQVSGQATRLHVYKEPGDRGMLFRALQTTAPLKRFVPKTPNICG